MCIIPSYHHYLLNIQWHVNQGRHTEAEPLYRRALDGREKVLGAEHPDTLASLNNLAILLENQVIMMLCCVTSLKSTIHHQNH